MKFWIYLTIALLSSLLSLLISPIRGGYISIPSLTSIQLSSLTAFFVYYGFTFLVIQRKQKNNPFHLLLAVIVGISALQLPSRMLYFHSTLSTFLDCLIGLSGAIFGYFTFKIKKRRILLVVVSSVIGIWLSIIGNDLWDNSLNYGSVTGKVDDDTIYDIQFQNITKDTISLEALNKRFILLDCWFTNCGECYKDMPRIQKIHDKYRNDSLVGIYSLHCRIESEMENHTTGKSILEKRGYDIPILSIDINASILNELKLKAFPTVLIFDNNQLVFRGNIKNAEKYLDSVLSYDH